MRRLSIIDLETGHQPIGNEDGTIQVVFNGEIYNYPDLIADLTDKGHVFTTKTDTEVLVHLYEEYGEDMCQYLRGMFAFAIWDGNRQRLFLARDRFGKKPLYYMITKQGGLLFCSELKGLRTLTRAAGEALEVSEQGIYDYLSAGAIPQPNTIYTNVFTLPPASWMTFDGRDTTLESYWKPEYLPKLSISYEEAQEQVRLLIREAVRIRLRSDVPLGVFLSGGVDSSIIAYEAAQEVGETLQTFTVSVDVKALDESSMAARTATAFGVKNTILPLKIDPLEDLLALVRQYDQPFADPSAIPSLAISKLARQHVTVTLNGDGGDELFGGYRRHVAAKQTQYFEWIPKSLLRTLAGSTANITTQRRSWFALGRRFARTMTYEGGERYLVRTNDTLRESDKEKFWRKGKLRPTESWIEGIAPPNLSPFDTQLYTDVRFNLLNSLLVKIDIATMAASLEGRSPLMDHIVGEFAFRLPANYHVRGFRSKALLKDAYRGRVPDEVLSAPKRGFEIPLASWLRTSLRPITEELLTPRSSKVRTYVTDEYVDGILNETIMTDRRWSSLLYSLLLLELWLREDAGL